MQFLPGMQKRRFRHCQLNRCKFLLAAVLTLVTLSALKLHQKALLDHRHLELGEDPYSSVNCTKILRGDAEEIIKARLELLTVKFKKHPRLTTDNYINMTKDCDYFTNERRYILEPLTKEEEEFPIAYSIVVHHKIDMFERLLRSIYTPQNYYCIHVDMKSPDSFLAAVRGIVSCFDNVFIASQLESVVYGSFSRVKADINCMKDLSRKSTSWKYLINLCGMDFPIKTNLEIVEKLKYLKGENSLETEKMPLNKEERWKKHYEIVDDHVKNTGIDKYWPPIQTPIFSGSAYFVVSRKFVEYVLENVGIQRFIEWSKDTYSPDEYLWATIQRIPEVPGSVPISQKFDVSDMNSVARFVKWEYSEGDVAHGAPYPRCNGLHVRSICVFGAGDLNWMLRNHHFFANKFDTDVDPFAVQCLEEYLRDKALHWQTRS